MIRLQIKIPNAQSVYLNVDATDNLELLRERLKKEKVKVFDETELTLLHPPKTLILKRDSLMKFADLGISNSATFIFRNPKIATISKNEKRALERAEFKEKMIKLEADDKLKEKKRRETLVENILAEVEADRRLRADRHSSKAIMKQLQADVAEDQRDPNLARIRIKPSNGENVKIVEIPSNSTLSNLDAQIKEIFEMGTEECVILQNPLQQTTITIEEENKTSPLTDFGITGSVFFILKLSRKYIPPPTNDLYTKENDYEEEDDYSDTKKYEEGEDDYSD